MLFRRLAAGHSPHDRLLPKADGGKWLKSHQTRPMKETCIRATIEPPANFHVLRHTYASLTIMNGAPLMVVARNLGHTDTRMVEKHYGHLAPSYVAEQIRAAAPRFGINSQRDLNWQHVMRHDSIFKSIDDDEARRLLEEILYLRSAANDAPTDGRYPAAAEV